MPWPYPRQPGKPAVAGVYDALRGGHRHLEPSRLLAEVIRERFPGTGDLLRDERAFLRRAVTWAARQGIRQYVGVGGAMPLQEGRNTHDFARQVIPDARVVYASPDEYAAEYSRALLARGTPGIAVVEADLRWPYAVMTHPELAGLIDYGEPACVALTMVMHFVPPDEAAPVISRFADWLAPGSCMIVSLLIPDGSGRGPEFASLVGQAAAMYRHTPEDVAGWLRRAELEIVPAPLTGAGQPGVVPVRAWPSGGWAAGQLAGRPAVYAAGAVAVRRSPG